jgi:beta-ureidopropionase
MSRVLRVAMTETKNVYSPMPTEAGNQASLRGKLDDVREANLGHHTELIAEAARAGARVLCCGELFAGPYFACSEEPLWLDFAEDALSGPTVSALSPVALEHSMILVAPIYEYCSDSGKRFNTAVVINESGEVIGKYRKTHIPQGTNEEGSFCERAYYEASDGRLGDWPANVSSNPYFPVFETSRVKLGVAICYDRHFEGSVRSLAKGGAELVFCPAVTFGAEARRMWELEFPVEAARHRLFIGGSNRRGAEAPWDQEFFGGSYFVGPEGSLEDPSCTGELVMADLDLESLGEAGSSGWSLRADARPEIYE